MKALLIIPAFNEGVKLEMTAKRVREYLDHRKSTFTIDSLIADDGSTESTPKQLADNLKFLYLRNERRMGVGSLIRRAYDFGLENGYDVLMTMAGNNKDNPNEIDRLLSPILTGKADFVQGSRYLPGGDFGNMPSYRLITTRYVHPWLFSFMTGQRITDSTNGFRAIRSSLLHDQRINLHQEWLDHYELEPYLFYQAIRLKYRVTEVPVSKIYPDKKLGYSKMTPFVSWWSILKPLFYLYFGIKK